jgi:hypothetical protein
MVDQLPKPDSLATEPKVYVDANNGCREANVP